MLEHWGAVQNRCGGGDEAPLPTFRGRKEKDWKFSYLENQISNVSLSLRLVARTAEKETKGWVLRGLLFCITKLVALLDSKPQIFTTLIRVSF